MSVYAFENAIAYHVVFILFIIIICILIGISFLEIYRSRFMHHQKKQLNIVRYIAAWCLIIQLITFIGYYTQSVITYCIMWNIWIPSWCWGYARLR